MHFLGSRSLCSSRLRLQEKSLADQLPWEQNVLKVVLGWQLFELTTPSAGGFCELCMATKLNLLFHSSFFNCALERIHAFLPAA